MTSKDIAAIFNGYNVQSNAVHISIPDARNTLAQCINYVLQAEQRGKSLVWNNSYDEIAQWLTDNQGKGLWLAGDCGTGKTLITTKVIPRLLEYYHKKICYTYTARNLGQRIGNANNKYLLLDEALTKHLLIIDEIGEENEIKDYGTKRIAFAEIVDNAEKNDVLLIFTTNLTKSEIEKKYGKRIIDRLQAITKFISIYGQSNRQ